MEDFVKLRRKREPLDAKTYADMAAAIGLAHAMGTSVIEELHRADLVLTPQHLRRNRDQVLGALIELLENVRPVELLRRINKTGGSGTPTDMYAAILDFLREFRETLGKET